jgi:23S rRNA (uracil1939-C5)-methyltransferase
LAEDRIEMPPEKDRFTVYSRLSTFLSEGGVKRGKVSLLDREILTDASVFFQSNGVLLEEVIKKLLELTENISANGRIADLYCGVGTFAAFLQERFSEIYLVEQNKSAVSLARENVRGKKMQFAALSVDQWVKTLSERENYEFIIADPPRDGLSPSVRSWLSRSGTPVFAYLSCDPASLARDARELVQGGYALEELNFYDFYPQTAHIESLAVFRK